MHPGSLLVHASSGTCCRTERVPMNHSYRTTLWALPSHRQGDSPIGRQGTLLRGVVRVPRRSPGRTTGRRPRLRQGSPARANLDRNRITRREALQQERAYQIKQQQKQREENGSAGKGAKEATAVADFWSVKPTTGEAESFPDMEMSPPAARPRFRSRMKAFSWRRAINYAGDYVDSQQGRIVNALSSILFIVSYIVGTYKQTPLVRSLLTSLERILCLGFASDLTIRVLREKKLEQKLDVLLSVEGLLDIVSFIPTVIEFLDQYIGDENFHVVPSLNLLRVFRLVRILRVALLVPFLKSSFNRNMLSEDEGSYGRDGTTTISDIVNLRIATLTVTVSTLLLSSAAIVQIVEGLQWHEAFYFIVTTLTTVGFGDITPSTTLGELTVVHVGVQLYLMTGSGSAIA
eukprot:scaffold1561_cov404-Prasinococcus_capsulatus_cf.AAC.9